MGRIINLSELVAKVFLTLARSCALYTNLAVKKSFQIAKDRSAEMFRNIETHSQPHFDDLQIARGRPPDVLNPFRNSLYSVSYENAFFTSTLSIRHELHMISPLIDTLLRRDRFEDEIDALDDPTSSRHAKPNARLVRTNCLR